MFTRLVRVIAARKRWEAERAAAAGTGRQEAEELPPLTRQALGMIKLPEGKSDRELIEEALLEKYGFDA